MSGCFVRLFGLVECRSRGRLERAYATTGTEDCRGHRAGSSCGHGGESFVSRQERFDTISGELAGELEALGARTAKPEQAAATVAVSLSENPQSFVWIAEIQQGTGESAVVMVSVPRARRSRMRARVHAGEPSQDSAVGAGGAAFWMC